MPPYNPSIPQATDKLSNSQPQLLQNFQAIDTGFSFNHVNLNLADAGKHNLLTMPQQAFPQAVTGTDLLFYVGLNPDTALSDLYFKRSTDAGNGIAITAGVSDAATYGWSTLPSGAKVKWGTFSFSGAVLQTVVMHGPQFTGVGSYSVSVSIDSTTTVASITVHNFSTTQFEFLSNVAAVNTYRYIAIGV